MALPQWMSGYPGAPVLGQPDYDSQDDEPAGLTPLSAVRRRGLPQMR